MNIKSFGCSFIAGHELRDIKTNTASHLTWPALMAKKLNCDYVCCAQGGSGNLQIAESVLNQLADSNSKLYIIGWTWIDRFDYTTFDNQWHTVMPVHTDNRAVVYYRDLHSQYRDKLTSLMNIKLVIDAMINKNQPFIMTYMDELLFETEWHVTPAVIELQNYIKPYMTKFENKNFLDWSRDCGYPVSENWHPFEQAHEAAAEYISRLYLKE